MLAQIEEMKQLYIECMDIHMAKVAEAAGVKKVAQDWSNVDLEKVVKEKGLEWLMQSQAELMNLNRLAKYLKELSAGSPFMAERVH